MNPAPDTFISPTIMDPDGINLRGNLDDLPLPPRAPGPDPGAHGTAGRGSRDGKGQRDKKSGRGARPPLGRMTLRDPELYQALMAECSKEERSTQQKREYVAPELVVNYLAANDVRPLKKVGKYPLFMENIIGDY